MGVQQGARSIQWGPVKMSLRQVPSLLHSEAPELRGTNLQRDNSAPSTGLAQTTSPPEAERDFCLALYLTP